MFCILMREYLALKKILQMQHRHHLHILFHPAPTHLLLVCSVLLSSDIVVFILVFPIRLISFSHILSFLSLCFSLSLHPSPTLSLSPFLAFSFPSVSVPLSAIFNREQQTVKTGNRRCVVCVFLLVLYVCRGSMV